MPKRVHILILLSHFLPGFKAGGPVRSVANLVSGIGDEFDFSVLTSDRDLGDDAPYPGVPLNRWIDAEGGAVCYLGSDKNLTKRVLRTIRTGKHDAIYLNSVFSVNFSIIPILARRFGFLPNVPVILAPRGEFSSGALKLKKYRKRAYIFVGRAIGLFRGLIWHASTEHEAADITRVMRVPLERIMIASDLPVRFSETVHARAIRAPGDPLRLVFLSRISPMKNLDYALKILANVEMSVEFTIVGPCEDEAYAELCRELANAVPANVQVIWKPAVTPDEVPGELAKHDLFFLPTRGENFGHIIVEALGVGTPVLISDKTPWRNLSAQGVGYDLPLDQPELFQQALLEFWCQSQVSAQEMQKKAAQFVRLMQESGADVAANRTLFRSAVKENGAKQ